MDDSPASCYFNLEIIWKGILLHSPASIYQASWGFVFHYPLLHILLLIFTNYWEPQNFHPLIRTVSWPPRYYYTIWPRDYGLVILKSTHNRTSDKLLLIDRLFDWLLSWDDAAGRRKRERDGEFKRLAHRGWLLMTPPIWHVLPANGIIMNSTGALDPVDRHRVLPLPWYLCDIPPYFALSWVGVGI